MFHLVAPFLIQTKLGYSSIVYGHMGFTLGFCFFAGSILNRFLLPKFDIKNLLFYQLGIIVLISLAMVLISHTMPMTLLSIVLSIFMLGCLIGGIYSNSMTLALKNFAHIGGTASAILGVSLLLIVTLSNYILSFLSKYSATEYTWIYFAACSIAFICYLILVRPQNAS